MPFALTAMAVVARIRMLASALVVDVVAVYNALVDVAPALPVHFVKAGCMVGLSKHTPDDWLHMVRAPGSVQCDDV